MSVIGAAAMQHPLADLSDARAAFARLIRERTGYGRPIAAVFAADLVEDLQAHQAGRLIPPGDASTRRQAMRDLHAAGITIETLAALFKADRRAVLFALGRRSEYES
jgi:hypothetical protein